MLYLSTSLGRTMICNALGLEGNHGQQRDEPQATQKFFSTSACSWPQRLTCEVVRLDPDHAAALSCSCLQRCAGRLSEPREPGELLAATVGVGHEAAVRGIADDRGRAR